MPRTRRLAKLLAVLVATGMPALADALSDGLAAYQAGDYKAARTLWQPLAKNGDMQAQFNVGLLYFGGRGLDQDYGEAAVWWRKSAAQGSAFAQLGLGSLYAKGLGVEQSASAAVSWYQKSAEQGNAEAQFRLAALFKEGKGIEKDPVRAHMWATVAVANGHENAGLWRDAVSGTLTPEQLDAAQNLARDWLLQHSKQK